MESQCCCVKPGESKEFTVKVKLSCTPEEGSNCCTVSIDCCPDGDCCEESSPK